MKRYEYAISPSGAITYNAPEGFHDDAVIGLALSSSRVANRLTPSMSAFMHRGPGMSFRGSNRMIKSDHDRCI